MKTPTPGSVYKSLSERIKEEEEKSRNDFESMQKIIKIEEDKLNSVLIYAKGNGLFLSLLEAIDSGHFDTKDYIVCYDEESERIKFYYGKYFVIFSDYKKFIKIHKKQIKDINLSQKLIDANEVVFEKVKANLSSRSKSIVFCFLSEDVNGKPDSSSFLLKDIMSKCSRTLYGIFYGIMHIDYNLVNPFDRERFISYSEYIKILNRKNNAGK